MNKFLPKMKKVESHTIAEIYPFSGDLGYDPQNLIAELRPGTHLCCLYATEEEHRAVLIPFLRQGLKRREKVLYIGEPANAEKVIDYLSSGGFDCGPFIGSEQFVILSNNDVYLQGGDFDAHTMINYLRMETDRALDEGYTALRVAGEMTWALSSPPGVERLIAYEVRLYDLFQYSQCTALCLYDRRIFTAEILLQVLRTHPVVVVGSEALKNHYYIPPEKSFGEEDYTFELETWMSNLSEKARAQEWFLRLCEKLNAEKRKLEDVVTGINAGLTLLDADARVVWANDILQEWFGPIEELKGKLCYELYKQDDPQTECCAFRSLKNGQIERGEILVDTIQGENRHFQLITSPQKNKHGTITQIVMLTVDITEKVAAEEQILAALREKEVMLAEIHHRVKNNLQVISSLLDFQTEYARDDHTVRLLRDSQRRIKSIALVHEQLYQVTDLAKIDFGAYVFDLTNQVSAIYGVDPDRVDYLLEIDDIYLDVKTAIPCGFIISELVSNALNHAFVQTDNGSEDFRGEILIAFSVNEEDECMLKVSDNGNGLPSDFIFPSSKKLGMSMIDTYAKQLGGRVEWYQHEGTTCLITFSSCAITGSPFRD